MNKTGMNWGDTRLPERFWLKCIPEPNSGCWLWIGAMNNLGYGQMYWNGKVAYSHRIAHQVSVGDAAEGMDIDHLCRNPACCNPVHLEAVSHTENVRRGAASGNKPHRVKSHCPKGHPYSGDNIFLRTNRKRPDRQCRECWRLRSEKYNEDKRRTA